MNDTPHTDDVQELIASYVLGQLEGQELARCQQAIDADPALAEEVASLQRTLALLPQATQTQPPAHLRERVMHAARAQAPSSAQVVSLRPARARWALASAYLLAAAASIACIMLVVNHGQQQRATVLEQQAAAMLREPNVVLPFVLHGRGAAATASGFVYLDLDARRAAMAMRDLPAAPPGQTYYLWAELESGSVPCGQFSPDKDGAIATVFSIPVESYTSRIKRLMLTLESSNDTTVKLPTGPIVMTSTVVG